MLGNSIDLLFFTTIIDATPTNSNITVMTTSTSATTINIISAINYCLLQVLYYDSFYIYRYRSGLIGTTAILRIMMHLWFEKSLFEQSLFGNEIQMDSHAILY